MKKSRAANTALIAIFDPMENILLIRLKSIGDVVLTLPAVNAVRENFPAAKITFLTSKENGRLLQGFREVDEIVTIDRAAVRTGNPLKVAPEFFRLFKKMRTGKFSIAVDFQGYGETAWLTRLTGAPERWGTVYRAGRGWAYTRQIKSAPNIHAAEGHLLLLESCGLKTGAAPNKFILPASAVDEARQWFASRNLDAASPTIYLQPFTSAPHKNWPFENYLAFANHWRAHGVQVIIGGGPKDKLLLNRAVDQGFAVPAGLSQLADAGLIKLSTLTVGGDTGFMHLAVALGKRVVMLMLLQGPSSAVPFRHPEWVIAPKAGAPLAEVTLGKMIEATGAALAEAGINI